MSYHGAVFWSELSTSDLEAAKAFYGATFGWEFTEIATPIGPYTLARCPGRDRPVAGFLAWPEGESGADQWFTYVGIDDIDAALARIVASGGRATPTFQVPGVGRFATVTDPNGGTFGLAERAPRV